MNNPLLEWDVLPPFSRIRPEHIEPAVDAVLADNRAALESLSTIAAPDWINFIEPQEDLADRLHRAWAPVGHLNAVMSNKELRTAYNACLARLAEYDTELGQNEALQRGYRALKAGPEWPGYSPARRKLVDDALRDFRLSGVDLPPEKKARFRAVMQELTQLEAKFEDNVLDATQGRITQVTVSMKNAPEAFTGAGAGARETSFIGVSTLSGSASNVAADIGDGARRAGDVDAALGLVLARPAAGADVLPSSTG